MRPSVNRCGQQILGFRPAFSAPDRLAAQNAEFCDANAIQAPLGLATVICDHSRDFSVLAELHELGGFCAFLVLVTNHDTGQTKHHIREFKVDGWPGFVPSILKLSSHYRTLAAPSFAGVAKGGLAIPVGFNYLLRRKSARGRTADVVVTPSFEQREEWGAHFRGTDTGITRMGHRLLRASVSPW